MEIYFKSKKMQKQCSEDRTMQKAFGRKMCKRLKQRLMELSAADNLADISHLPPPRCHELRNRKGVFSVDLEQPYRLLFEAANEPIPRNASGGVELSLVTEIMVIEIADTHDPKAQRRNK
ncbi:MAG: type II toxin-antitoxin system RelE/ParE family toxin [Candidatus Sumerlaeia bacterium]